MVFDDDAKLIGLFQRYQDEMDNLKDNIVEYIKGSNDIAESELQDVSTNTYEHIK